MTDAKKKDGTILQERVAARLSELRRSPREVSLKAGLGPDAIRTILTGRSRSPRGQTLAALADELQCDVGYLIGTLDTPYASEELRTNDVGVVRGIAKMPIAGEVKSSWTVLPEAEQYEDWPGSDIFSVPEFLPGYQTLQRVVDSSADLIAPVGSFLHVLGLRSSDIEVRDKDIVILGQQRLTADGVGEYRQTCKEVRRYHDGLIVLRAPTSIRSLHDEITFEGKQMDVLRGSRHTLDGQAIWIEGLVLRAIIPLAGPDVVRR